MKRGDTIRILIVDDHGMVRQTLKSLSQTHSDIEIIGEASNGEEALLKVATLQPAMVVMDIIMPKVDGIAATRMIKTQYPEITVLGLSLHAKSYEVKAMLHAGASEVITKDDIFHDLYGAIQRTIDSG